MPDQRHRQRVLSASFVALLLTVAAGAVNDNLVDAAKSQNWPQVRTLLGGRADANSRSADGSTALLWAAHWNELQTASLLLRSGADPNAANDLKMTPLSQACINASSAMVDLLVQAGANPNTPI